MCAIPFFEICPGNSEAPTLNLTLVSQVFCPFGLTILKQTGGQNNQQLFRQTAEPRGDHIAEWSESTGGQRPDERLTMFGFCLTHEVRRLASVCFSVSAQIYCKSLENKPNTMSLCLNTCLQYRSTYIFTLSIQNQSKAINQYIF